MSRSDRIAALVASLAAEVDGEGSRAPEHADGGALAALDPGVVRQLVGAAARCYAVAAEEAAEHAAGRPTGNGTPDAAGAEELQATDLTPTEAVVLASAALRAHDLNPFDLALWFPRSAR